MKEMPLKAMGSPQSFQIVDTENSNKKKSSEEVLESKNKQISIKYVKEKWNREILLWTICFHIQWLLEL